MVDKSGIYLAYLNVTPKQGAERLDTWPSFRAEHLREESALSVHEDAHALSLSFRGGTGSCVIEDYVTRAKNHHDHEIACFVQGSRSASVLVAAAPSYAWGKYAAQLERAISAFRVT